MNTNQRLDDFFSEFALTPGVNASPLPGQYPAVPPSPTAGASWHSGLTPSGEPVLALVVRGEAVGDVLDSVRRLSLVSLQGVVPVRDHVQLENPSGTGSAVAVLFDAPKAPSLFELTREGALRTETARAIAGRAAEILESAHRKGIRDLSLDEHRVFVDTAADSVEILGMGVEDAAQGIDSSRYSPFVMSPDARSLGRLLYVGLAGRGPEFFADDAPANPALTSARKVPADLGQLTAELINGSALTLDSLPYTVGDVREALSPWQSLPVTLEAFDPDQHAGGPVPLAEREDLVAKSDVHQGAAFASVPLLAEESEPETQLVAATKNETATTPTHRIEDESDSLDATQVLPHIDLPEEEAPSRGASAPVWGEIIDVPAPRSEQPQVQARPIPIAGRNDSLSQPGDSQQASEPEGRPSRPPLVPPSVAVTTQSAIGAAAVGAIPVSGRTESFLEAAPPAPANSAFRNVMSVALDAEGPEVEQVAERRAATSTNSRIILIAAGLVVMLGLVFALTSITSLLRGDRDVASHPVASHAAQASAAKSKAAAKSAPAATTTAPAKAATLQGVEVVYPPDQAKADYPDKAGLMTDNDPKTAWKTQRYHDEKFGGLREGMGVKLNVTSDGVVSNVVVTPGAQNGGTLELYALDAQGNRGELLASGTVTAGQPLTLTLAKPVQAQSLLLWAPTLGQVSGGYRLEIADIAINRS